MIHEGTEGTQETKTQNTCVLATQQDTCGEFVVCF